MMTFNFLPHSRYFKELGSILEFQPPDILPNFKMFGSKLGLSEFNLKVWIFNVNINFSTSDNMYWQFITMSRALSRSEVKFGQIMMLAYGSHGLIIDMETQVHCSYGELNTWIHLGYIFGEHHLC